MNWPTDLFNRPGRLSHDQNRYKNRPSIAKAHWAKPPMRDCRVDNISINTNYMVFTLSRVVFVHRAVLCDVWRDVHEFFDTDLQELFSHVVSHEDVKRSCSNWRGKGRCRRPQAKQRVNIFKTVSKVISLSSRSTVKAQWFGALSQVCIIEHCVFVPKRVLVWPDWLDCSIAEYHCQKYMFPTPLNSRPNMSWICKNDLDVNFVQLYSQLCDICFDTASAFPRHGNYHV